MSAVAGSRGGRIWYRPAASAASAHSLTSTPSGRADHCVDAPFLPQLEVLGRLEVHADWEEVVERSGGGTVGTVHPACRTPSSAPSRRPSSLRRACPPCRHSARCPPCRPARCARRWRRSADDNGDNGEHDDGTMKAPRFAVSGVARRSAMTSGPSRRPRCPWSPARNPTVAGSTGRRPMAISCDDVRRSTNGSRGDLVQRALGRPPTLHDQCGEQRGADLRLAASRTRWRTFRVAFRRSWSPASAVPTMPGCANRAVTHRSRAAHGQIGVEALEHRGERAATLLEGGRCAPGPLEEVRLEERSQYMAVEARDGEAHYPPSAASAAEDRARRRRATSRLRTSPSRTAPSARRPPERRQGTPGRGWIGPRRCSRTSATTARRSTSADVTWGWLRCPAYQVPRANSPFSAGEACGPGRACASAQCSTPDGDRVSSEILTAPGPVDEFRCLLDAEVGEPAGIDVPVVHPPSLGDAGQRCCLSALPSGPSV